VTLTKKPSVSEGCFYLWRNKLTVILMNLTVFPLLILMTVIGIVIAFPLFIIFKIVTGLETLRIIRIFVWMYGRGWLAIIKPFSGLQSHGLGKGDVPLPCIIVPNHLSFFDTFFMGALPFTNICFAIRSWPFKMFWYNPFMRLAQYLDVEKMTWEETFEACKKELQRGTAILFFPEAHRSRDGKLGRFHSGAFKLSVEIGAPIIPLCITGTGEMYPPGRRHFKPANIRLVALPAVSPAGFSGPEGHINMRHFVKDMMAQKIEEMKAENILSPSGGGRGRK
jgi:1-acyl-sn-glycerol-3-phosphate acyltransferase